MYDVIIIGGGLYGSSTAYHLLNREPGLRVLVIEPDPGYTHAASARSNGGVRVLFSQPESIQMSRFGHEFYRDFAARAAIDDEPANLDLYPLGYLIMATTPNQVEDLEANHAIQTSLGCAVDLLDPAALSKRFPSIATDDLLLAVHSPEDMWIDAHGAVTGLARKARHLGAEYRKRSVSGLNANGKTVDSVILDDGETVSGHWVVNAAGAWAPEICGYLNLEIPVVPVPQMVFYFETRNSVEQFGVTIDCDRVSFRPEGAGFISINRRAELAGQFCWEPDLRLFEAENWPKLAHRIPAFEAVGMKSAYCCHYAQNQFDGNLLLGSWPGRPDNFLIATGASGHGLQHAPAAGRALSELILDGGFTTLDLARFGCQRVVDNRPDPERGFVA